MVFGIAEYDTQAAAVAAADVISGTPGGEGIVALIEALLPGVRTVGQLATRLEHFSTEMSRKEF
jgi:hypothetical protein